MMYSFVIPLIYVTSVNCLLPRWKYKTKLGHIEYCCRCSHDFVVEDVIEECFAKNKQNYSLLPFCNCHKGYIPKCSKTVKICNQTMVCPNDNVYSNCQVPFLENATLTCNDNLQWEPSFQCPKEEHECPHDISVCGKNIQPNQTAVGTEFDEILSDSHVHFKCRSDYEWEYDYQCLNGGELSLQNSNTEYTKFLLLLLSLLLLLLLLKIVINYCEYILHRSTGDCFPGRKILKYFTDLVVKYILCKSLNGEENVEHELMLFGNHGNTSGKNKEPLTTTVESEGAYGGEQPSEKLGLVVSTMNESEENGAGCVENNENACQSSKLMMNSETDVSDVGEGQPSSDAPDSMNTGIENILPKEQLSWTLQPDSPPKEFESSAQHIGNSTESCKSDVQPEDCGDDTSDIERNQLLLDTFNNMNAGIANILPKEQLSWTLQPDSPPKEFESSAQDIGNSTESCKSDVQPEDCGDDTSDIERNQSLLDTFNNMREDDSISYHDENLPTASPTLQKNSNTKSTLRKNFSLSYIRDANSSKLQNGTSLRSLPSYLNDSAYHLSRPIQECGSTATSVYVIGTCMASYSDIPFDVEVLTANRSLTSLNNDIHLNYEVPADTTYKSFVSPV